MLKSIILVKSSFGRLLAAQVPIKGDSIDSMLSLVFRVLAVRGAEWTIEDRQPAH
ncbi:hypothetical protein X773_25965 [Mesorhizobium sp. LSJC285A00]|nr:hypothetical protein X773_25965 [Mesorhizobium sp. LSJC285A00]